MKKICCGMFALLLCLSGCGGKETTTVCRGNVNGMEDIMTMTASGDKVKTSTEEVILNYADFALETEEEKETFMALMEEQFSSMEQEGIAVETETTEETMTIRVIFDLSKVDYDSLVSMGFAEESDQEVNYISLKESIAGFEANGFTCETK